MALSQVKPGSAASGYYYYELGYKTIDPSRTQSIAFFPQRLGQRRQPLSLLQASLHNETIRHYSVLNDLECGWMATQHSSPISS